MFEKIKKLIKGNKILIATVLIVAILDKFAKILIKHLYRGEIKIIGDFLKITLIENKGIAFGMFSDLEHPLKPILLLILSIAAIIFMINIYKKSNRNVLMQISFGLIFGGAFGNIYDRIIYRKVMDFINIDFFNIYIPAFHFFGLQFPGFEMERWPIWNIADASITVGVMLIMLLILLKKDKL